MVLVLQSQADADAIKLPGGWLKDVHISSVQDGRLVYVTANGVRGARPVGEIESLRLDRYPKLNEAMLAIERGFTSDAIKPLRDTMDEAKDGWVRQYAAARLLDALGASGLPVDATNVYIELVQRGFDSAIVPRPPVAAVRSANRVQKEKIAQTIRALLPNLDDVQQQQLASLLEVAAADDVTEAAPTPTEFVADPLVAKTEMRRGPVVVLPDGMVHDDVSRLLQRGQFLDALTRIEPRLQQAGQLDRKLYLAGIAHLGLADAERDPDHYKRAGLAFMRVAIYFPQSNYVGPSLVEAGYVHQSLGAVDRAARLYRQAELLIDPEVDRGYHRRLEQLLSRSSRR